MNFERLRQLLLQKAIEGKLVPQLDEEPSVPQIGEPPKDVPFAIPEKWKWVQLEEVCSLIKRGKSPKYSDVQKIPVIAQKCNQWDGFYIDKAKFIDPNTISKYSDDMKIRNLDVMVNSTGLGTLGRVGIYTKDRDPYEVTVWDSHVTVLRANYAIVNPYFVYFFLRSPTVQSVIEIISDGTTNQKELSTKTIKSFAFPLPPIEEQRRIVEKLNALLAMLKKAEDAYKDLQALGDNLRAKMLQKAIEGKLVPQLEEEPSVEQIGEAPKDVPFAIPEKWKWVQSYAIQDLVRGITFPASAKKLIQSDSEVRCLTTGSIQEKYKASSDVFVNKSFVKNDRQYLRSGDVVISSANSKELVGKSICWKENASGSITFGGFLTVARTKDAAVLSGEFLALTYKYLFVSSFFANLSTQTTNIANLSNKTLNSLVFPVPPLAEQRRIVEKLNALLPLVDEMTA